MEFWTTGPASPRGVMKLAVDLEAGGWDGLAVVDSQNLSGDPYVALAMAATVTERLGLGTGVTNSVTRQPAVTATSIASVQRVSGGRAHLGIGRGDSALAHLGRSPGRVGHFEAYIEQLQAYLSGRAVPFSAIDIPPDIAAPIAELRLANAPADSRIDWIANGKSPKVPIEVAATGPKVIAIGARLADRVMFTLGADPVRLAWGIKLARKARSEAGLDPDSLKFGAFINCACHPHITTARNLVRGGLTTFARFNVMHGRTSGPLQENIEAVLQDVGKNYDMRKHTKGDSRQAGVLTPEFIDHFAVVGKVEQVIERLRALAALGLDKLILGGGTSAFAGADATLSKELLQSEVFPALRA